MLGTWALKHRQAPSEQGRLLSLLLWVNVNGKPERTRGFWQPHIRRQHRSNTGIERVHELHVLTGNGLPLCFRTCPPSHLSMSSAKGEGLGIKLVRAKWYAATLANPVRESWIALASSSSAVCPPLLTFVK